MIDELFDHELADEAGAPDDDAFGHRVISPEFTKRC
jgi:hypothetical protein